MDRRLTSSSSTTTPDPSPSIIPTTDIVRLVVKKPARKVSRKVSHSLIERRRREKINDCLDTLKQIVPQCQEQMNKRLEAKARKLEMAKKRGVKRTRDHLEDEEEPSGPALHKLEILQATVTYIQELRHTIATLQPNSPRVINTAVPPPTRSSPQEETISQPSSISSPSQYLRECVPEPPTLLLPPPFFNFPRSKEEDSAAASGLLSLRFS